jgi:hypothetical protein
LPAKVQVDRIDGWLPNDRIRLTDPLRKSPAPAGFFYGCSGWVLVTVDRSGGPPGAVSIEPLGTEELVGGNYEWTPGVTVRGSVLVSVKANKMLEVSMLKYEASKGKQKIEKFEGAPADILEASFSGGTFEQAGLTATLTQTSEEEVEINTSI